MKNYKRRTYDHRIKLAVIKSKNINLFPELNIPATTAKNWINRGLNNVVTNNIFDLNHKELELKCIDLEEKVKILESKFKLLKVVSKALGLNTQYERYKADVKKNIIESINVAKSVLTLDLCLKTVGLSKQRFSGWLARMKSCSLTDFSSCPKVFKTKLMPTEIQKIKTYVENPNYSHFSLTSLWLYVRKTEELTVSRSSWFRVIRELKLARENRKKYFCRPKIGFKSSDPNGSWHIDVSVLRFNNVKAYIQAVRDNFSRLILAYKVGLTYGGEETKLLIEEAIKKSQELGYLNIPEVISDKGSENINTHVGSLQNENYIKLTLAQVDIKFSNSMIESFFHQLKNRYLYYKDIHSVEELKKHIDFYIKEHNEVIPFISLGGATPLDAYKSKAAVIVDKNMEKEKVKSTIVKRIEFYNSLNCQKCS